MVAWKTSTGSSWAGVALKTNKMQGSVASISVREAVRSPVDATSNIFSLEAGPMII